MSEILSQKEVNKLLGDIEMPKYHWDTIQEIAEKLSQQFNRTTRKVLIPQHEQTNVLEVLWVILRSFEAKLDVTDVLDRNEVKQAYDLLNRIGFTKERPDHERETP